MQTHTFTPGCYRNSLMLTASSTSLRPLLVSDENKILLTRQIHDIFYVFVRRIFAINTNRPEQRPCTKIKSNCLQFQSNCTVIYSAETVSCQFYNNCQLVHLCFFLATHVAASLGTISSGAALSVESTPTTPGCSAVISTSISELEEFSSRSLSLISMTSSSMRRNFDETTTGDISNDNHNESKWEGSPVANKLCYLSIPLCSPLLFFLLRQSDACTHT